MRNQPNVEDGCLVYRAATAAEGYWLRSLAHDLNAAAQDHAVESDGDRVTLRVPLRRSGLSTATTGDRPFRATFAPAASNGPCKFCRQPVPGFAWWDKNPEKFPDAKPICEECFGKHG